MGQFKNLQDQQDQKKSHSDGNFLHDLNPKFGQITEEEKKEHVESVQRQATVLNQSNSIVHEAGEFDDASSKRSSKLDSDSELDSAGDVSSDGGGEYIDIPTIIMDGA